MKEQWDYTQVNPAAATRLHVGQGSSLTTALACMQVDPLLPLPGATEPPQGWGGGGGIVLARCINQHNAWWKVGTTGGLAESNTAAATNASSGAGLSDRTAPCLLGGFLGVPPDVFSQYLHTVAKFPFYKDTIMASTSNTITSSMPQRGTSE